MKVRNFKSIAKKGDLVSTTRSSDNCFVFVSAVDSKKILAKEILKVTTKGIELSLRASLINVSEITSVMPAATKKRRAYILSLL